MGRIMRLRDAVEDGHSTEDQIHAGGKPSSGTPKDKRLKQNKSSGGSVTSTPAKNTPAKVTRGM